MCQLSATHLERLTARSDRPLTTLRRATIGFYAIRLLSQAGQGIFIAALFVVVGGSGHVAAGLSGVLVAMTAASLITGIPGGMVADRLGPASGLSVGAWGRILVAGAALVLVHHPVTAILLSLGYSVVSQLFSASELAFIRHLDAARPARGHALLVIFQYVGQGTGLLVLAPALYFFGGASLMFAGAFAFYLAVGLISFLLLATPVTVASSVVRQRVGISIRPTLRFFAADGWAGYSAAVLAFLELVTKVLVVALPVLIIDEMDMSHLSIGILGAGVMVGGAIGFLWAANMRPSRTEEILRPMMLAVSAATGLLAITAYDVLSGTGEVGLVVALGPLAVVGGLSLTLAPIAARAVLTRRAPIEQQARVFATQGFATNVVVVVPLALAGAATEIAGAGTTLWILAITGAIAIIALELLPEGADEVVPQPLLSPPAHLAEPSDH